MGRIIGIDLGTTNTAVAVLEGGRPRAIEDERGYKVLPSVVSAKGDGRFVVGQAAASLILTRPDRTVFATKRLIGRRYDSPEVQRVKERVHYLVREASDGGVQVQVGDAWMTPQEVAAVVLQVARGIAEKALGEAVEEAVITVPAHFNHIQRAATLEAAQLAGLRCERLLNEPTAAALAYGHRRNIDRMLVVFDLGGGTFDVSVLRLRDGIYEILATSGDTFLGGEDFDYRVVDWLADGFMAKQGVDLRKDRGSLQRLKDAAERAKCELSFSDRANIVVPHAAPGKNLETVLTRRQLEEVTADLVERCVSVAREAVASAGLPIPEVDEVILVGGQTRMPRVREAVAALFGREASRTVHPEEAVAIGAAVHASNLEDVDGPRPVLLDVAPFDLGIDAVGSHFSVIIPKNARVPCSETKVFATVHDDQDSVRVTVRQGESRVSTENEFLGEFVFDGLPLAPKLQTKVAVTFRIDHNGMLHVSASDPATGARRNITIRNYAEHAKSPDVATVVEGGGGAMAAKLADAFGPPAGGKASPKAPAKAKAAAKKPGLLDMLLGRKKAAPKAAAPAPAPLPVVEPEPVAAPEAPAILLPEAPLFGDEEPLPADGLVELDDGQHVAPIDEDDLYGKPGGASFGLAGAHQVGTGARGGNDPFGEGPRATDAFQSLDADDLFGDAPADDDEEDADLPTDHGARVPTLSPPAPPAPPAAPPQAAAPRAAPPSRAPSGPPVISLDEDAFSMPEDLSSLFDDEPEAEVPAPAPRPLAAPTPSDVEEFASEDLGGLLFGGDLGSEEPVADAGAVPGLDADFGFADEPQELTAFALAEPPAGPPAEPDGEPDAAEPTGFAFAAPDEPTGFAFAEPEPEEPTGFAFAEPPAGPAPAAPTRGGRRLDEPAARRDDDTDEFAFAMPEDEPDAARPAAKKPKKPARIRLQYQDFAEFAAEYKENLRKNQSFIHTDKPLPVGRACVFEIGAPGLGEPLVFDAVVDAVSDGRNGSDAGMRVAWNLDAATRHRLERTLAGR